VDGGASLFERIGGEGAIMLAVSIFYRRVLEDPLLRRFFAALDMPAQTRKQVAFMSWAFGGPAAYQGRDLRAAHAPLVKRGLGPAHFEAVLGHLAETLEEMQVERALRDEVLAVVATTREQVLGV
jgi:hemoglobin